VAMFAPEDLWSWVSGDSMAADWVLVASI
jgi:hypothetical protein